jgi:hypothetical protein
MAVVLARPFSNQFFYFAGASLSPTDVSDKFQNGSHDTDLPNQLSVDSIQWLLSKVSWPPEFDFLHLHSGSYMIVGDFDTARRDNCPIWVYKGILDSVVILRIVDFSRNKYIGCLICDRYLSLGP